MAQLEIISDNSHLMRPEYPIGLFTIFINNFRTRWVLSASGEIAPGKLLGHRPQGPSLAAQTQHDQLSAAQRRAVL